MTELGFFGQEMPSGGESVDDHRVCSNVRAAAASRLKPSQRDGVRPAPCAQRGPELELLDAVLEENERLRLRVSQLEAGLAEYRRQMDEVLSSSSWRVTSPIRMVAGRVRRVRQVPRRIRRRVTGGPVAAPVAGLFPPTAVEPELAELVHRLAAPPNTLRARRPGGAVPIRKSRVLVVAHVYYPEVWDDIASRLARIPEPFDLLVTLVDDRADWLVPRIVGHFPYARVQTVPNRGRDLGPLVALANEGHFDGYEAILKVHTKRSPHRIDGDGWRIRLLDGLLPSPSEVGHVIELLSRDPSVGIIAPTGHVSGPDHWGRNQPLVQALAARLPLAIDPDTLEFAAGSMFWCRPWVLQRLADLDLSVDDFPDEGGQTDATTAHAIERLLGLLVTASGQQIVTMDDVPSRLHRSRAVSERPRVLAFYLPQYHRIAENDEWWGEGFTDWRNVESAAPLFARHLQPHVPTELGAYSLGPDVMRQQAQLAAEHGVDGFVMHHYWFNGRTLLNEPLESLLADPTIPFPFALCWANENWTRRWDGLDSDVLVSQTFPDGWAERYFDDILPALSDPRYVQVNGLPLLVLYRVGLIPNAAAAIAVWKARAEAAGLGGLHVAAVVPSRDFEPIPATVLSSLDSLVRFTPGSGIGLESLADDAAGYDQGNSGDVLSYEAAVRGADLSTSGAGGLRIHPGVMPGWDNTARRGSAAYVFHGSNPLTFRRWVAAASAAAVAAGSEPLVFVNAWNEWAEGAHLEPDQRFARGNLEAIHDVVGPRTCESSAESAAAPEQKEHER